MDSDDAGGTKRSRRGRGRGRGSRGRGRGRGRGKGKKASRVISSDEEEDGVSPEPEKENDDVIPEKQELAVGSKPRSEEIEPRKEVPLAVKSLPPPSQLPIVSAEPDPDQLTISPLAVSAPRIIDMEADISQLEAPTFTTITRGQPEPMLRLNWNHKVNLIGEKVLNPMIYCCDQCDKPILIYGRMIPCKHVFCLHCARSETLKECPRCNEKVIRVEQTGLGTVFMCTHGGTRYGNSGCRRTYLSQRDLQAHINHRHVPNQPEPTSVQQPQTVALPVPPTELLSMSKLMADKIAGGGTTPMRKNSCDRLNSHSTGHTASSDGVSQQSSTQQHLSRSTGYTPYGQQTSSPQQQQQQQQQSSISSSLWSQSTSQYYR